MSAFVDIARFRPDDPPELVAASLACPVCLHGKDVAWEEHLDDYEEFVGCRCANCGECWSVYLAPHQLVRMELLRTTGC